VRGAGERERRAREGRTGYVRDRCFQDLQRRVLIIVRPTGEKADEPVDSKDAFVAALQPVIDSLLDQYRESPQDFITGLPVNIHGYFNENSWSKKVALGARMARCLICTHRAPTAVYIWG
jgi:hypothetical protein